MTKKITSDFVVPSTTRLHLSDDRWIDVKKELTVSEEREMSTYGMGSFRAKNEESRARSGESRETEVKVDWADFSISKVVAYVVEWNLVGADGKQVPVTYDAVRNLRVERFNEIDKAVTEYAEKVKAEKNDESTQTPRSKISA